MVWHSRVRRMWLVRRFGCDSIGRQGGDAAHARLPRLIICSQGHSHESYCRVHEGWILGYCFEVLIRIVRSTGPCSARTRCWVSKPIPNAISTCCAPAQRTLCPVQRHSCSFEVQERQIRLRRLLPRAFSYWWLFARPYVSTSRLTSYANMCLVHRPMAFLHCWTASSGIWAPVEALCAVLRVWTSERMRLRVPVID